MAKSLGSFGVQRDQVDLDFEYFGHTIRVHPDASDLKSMDMLMAIGDLDMDDEDSANEIMSGLSEMLLGQIHPEDAEKFWEVSKQNRQQMKDIMAVSKAITEAVAGFPTSQPYASTPTATRVGQKSGGDSSSRRERRALARKARTNEDTQAALTLLHGRPDLQKAVVRSDAG